MRIEHFYFRVDHDSETNERVEIPTAKADATHTRFAATEVLEDGSEYGLSLTTEDVRDELTENEIQVAQSALDKYRIENGP